MLYGGEVFIEDISIIFVLISSVVFCEEDNVVFDYRWLVKWEEFSLWYLFNVCCLIIWCPLA